jgi:uncharacterized membrane protein YhaH (DUF805 family)
MDLMFAPFMRYADFSGRSRRMEFWLFTLMHGAVTIFLFMGFFGALIASQGVSGLSSSALNFLTLFVFWCLATFIPQIAVTVRRLHDINMSGWVYCITFVPFGAIVLLVLMCIDGTKGPNPFGPDPQDRGDGYWWEGDGGPPEGYRTPARTTGGEAPIYDDRMRDPAVVHSAAPASGFGRRVTGFPPSPSDLAEMSREEWLKRLEQS